MKPLCKAEKAVLCGLIVAVIASLCSFSYDCEKIDDTVIRLHILAASDEAEDQAVKLAVRDRLLDDAPELFAGADSKEAAAARVRDEMEHIREIVGQELVAQGTAPDFTLELCEDAYFDQRVYDGFTMPAGRYTALRITLGSGQGHNWWCVMYPPLCGNTARETVDTAFPARESRVLSNDGTYEIKFKLYEWLKHWFCGVK